MLKKLDNALFSLFKKKVLFSFCGSSTFLSLFNFLFKMAKKRQNKKKKQHISTEQANSSQKTFFSTTLATHLWYYLGIVGCCLLLYGNTVNNDYSFDDILNTPLNAKVAKGISGIPTIWTTPYIEDNKGLGRAGGYRPVAMTTFAIEYELFEKRPDISHLINAFLYTLCCLVLFKVLTLIFFQYHPLFSLLITLLFAAHPLHTEAVASLKNREEILMFLFSMLTALSALNYCSATKIIWIIVGSLCWLLAMFSKSGMIVFAFLIPLMLYFAQALSWKKSLLLIIPLFITGFGVIFSINSYLSPNLDITIFNMENPMAGQATVSNRLTMALYVMMYYVKLIVVPFPLLFYYGAGKINLVGWDNIWVWISLVFHVGIFIGAVRELPKRHPLSFAVFLYFFAISIYTNLVFVLAGVIADRYAFIAVLAFCIALVYLGAKILNIDFTKLPRTYFPTPTYTLVGLVGLLLIPYAFLTIQRNAQWKDAVTLIKHDIKYLQNASTSHYFYGNALSNYAEKAKKLRKKEKMKQYARQAVQSYERSLALNSGNLQAIRNTGYAYCQMLNEPSKAMRLFEKALNATQGDHETLKQVAECYSFHEDDRQAINFYEQYLNKIPEDVGAYAKLIGHYCGTNQLDKATQAAKIMEQQAKEPSDDLYMGLGTLHLCQGDTTKANDYFEQAVAINPSETKDLAFLIARYHLQKGDQEKHSQYLKIYNKIEE